MIVTRVDHTYNVQPDYVQVTEYMTRQDEANPTVERRIIQYKIMLYNSQGNLTEHNQKHGTTDVRA